MNLLHRQRGLSLWELLFYGVLIGVAALVVIKLLPLYMEKFKVEKAMQSLAAQPEIRTLEESDMKNRLLRHFEIEDVDKFSRPEDLKKIFTVTKNKDNEGRTMSMKYEIRAPFVGALDVVLKVDKQIAIPAYTPLSTLPRDTGEPRRRAEAALAGLCAKLRYEFTDGRLCTQALTHRSAGYPHNERLEFLGDAMLGLVVAEELYRRYPDADEGLLTRLRAALVRKETLAEVAAELDLGAHLRLGEGELKSGGFRRASILANALEAILGAIYLDGGYEPCRAAITRLLERRIASLSAAEMTKDPKTELQEWLQARGRPLPVYRTTRVEGDPHDQHFVVECMLEDATAPVTGEGRSRRHAEQQAAERMLARLRRPGARSD